MGGGRVTGWENFKAMVSRDFPWLVVSLILLLLLFIAVGKAADTENACHELYAPYVQSCYESHGLIPMVNYTFDLSIEDRTSGDRWLTTNEARE